MTATQGSVLTALILAIGSLLPGLGRATADTDGGLLPGAEPRDVRAVVDPEWLAVKALQELGAGIIYDESRARRSVIGVDLTGCPFTDDALKELAALRHLRNLHFGRGELTAAHVQTLSALKQLRKLDLSKASYTRLETGHLYRAMPQLSIVLNPDWTQTGYIRPQRIVP